MAVRNFTNAGWATGTYCNAQCKQCYSKKYRTSDSALTYEEIDIILQKLSDYGIQIINLGGNEPVFTDGKDIAKTKLPYLLKTAHRLGFTVGITTNGTTANYLYENTDAFEYVNDWDISFDSFMESEHNQNRGAVLYSSAVRAINRIHECQKSVSVVYCLMNWNSTKAHARTLSDFCAEHKTDLRVNTLKPIQEKHFSLLPAFKDIRTFFGVITQRFDVISSSDICAAEQLSPPQTKRCRCGYHSFSIGTKKSDGSVPISPCVYLQDFATGNLLLQDIDEIVSSAEIFEMLRKRYEQGAINCRKNGCTHLDFCRGGCAAYAYLTTGSVMNGDDRCPIFHGSDLSNLSCSVKSEVENKVHENYLCTYIGRLKKWQN